MPGQDYIQTVTSNEDQTGGGLPLVIIVENGNAEPCDEWALLRLTDAAYGFYQEGYEFRASILQMKIDGEPSYTEVSRHKTQALALEAEEKLSPEERARTLVRSVLVRPH